MSDGLEQSSHKHWATRTLGVERSEFAPVALSFLYFFCVLSSYFMLRSIRENVSVEVGFQNVPWLFSGTFIAMLLVTPIFGFIASRYPRKRFLPWVYYFFASNIVAFYVLFTLAASRGGGFDWVGIAFFIWLSVFNLFVVSVFWSFMADIYTHVQSRRLFGLISAGGSAGAVLGPLFTSEVVLIIGFANILPIAAGVLLIAVVCITRLKHWVMSEHEKDIETTVASSRALGGKFLSGAADMFKSRYFVLIGLGSVIASLMGTALYMFTIELTTGVFNSADERVQFFARLDFATNLMALLLQALVVRHAVHKLGLGLTLTLLPIYSLIGFALLATNPAFLVVAILQASRRALGFGFSKPTSDMLYSVVPDDQKYKVKNFIDTAIYRGGDLVGTWAIRGLQVAGLGIAGIALVMLPFAVIWAGIAIALGREYLKRDSASTDTVGQPSAAR